MQPWVRPLLLLAVSEMDKGGRRLTLEGIQGPYDGEIAMVPSTLLRPRTGGRRARSTTPRVNAFTRLVERTVEAMYVSSNDGSFEDLQKILATIRKQYDEVHCEAEKRERELLELRRDMWIIEAEAEDRPETLAYSSLTHEDLHAELQQLANEMREALETKKVYQHMVARLRRELRIVEEKNKLMEEHLRRKTHEVEQRQCVSRRVHKEKVQTINQLEDMEQDVEMERGLCNSALDDLELTLHRRNNEVRHREDFERWRFEVAMEAASEAFQATAGRFRKIYAIEKLTGNCLQKMIIVQAERSQATEDGFQRIREVTGLTDVMDIVHKFLNRDVEHEQLRNSVRESEMKLHSLREAEKARHSEDPFASDIYSDRPLGLAAEVADHEHRLTKATRDREDCHRKLRREMLLMDNIGRWSQRMSKSFACVEYIDTIKDPPRDVLPYFQKLVVVVDRFLTSLHEEMTAQKLLMVTNNASNREYEEQKRLLTDKEFLRSNCRVQASVENKPLLVGGQQGQTPRGAIAKEEERQDKEVATERERLKKESKHMTVDREDFRLDRLPSPDKAARDARRAESAGRRRHRDAHE